MSKFISRLTLSKEEFYIRLSDFELFAPGSNREYEHLNVELVRGKARKIIHASSSSKAAAAVSNSHGL